jgi:Arc/MetJ-type ribon-helix-helix transcriptional regulator
MPAKTDRITVRLPVPLIQSVDTLVELGTYRNRTDVLYNALKEFVQTQGAKAKETVEAERGLLELKKLAAEMDAMKQRLGLE